MLVDVVMILPSSHSGDLGFDAQWGPNYLTVEILYYVDCCSNSRRCTRGIKCYIRFSSQTFFNAAGGFFTISTGQYSLAVTNL